MKSTVIASTAILAIMIGCGLASAQQITGTPGSPSATTTIDGNYIPNPPPAFGGEINLNAKNSKPWWPPNIVPPKGAPNILLIMTDDQGYGISGTFGGVIPTPTMDRARGDMGLRYTAVPFDRPLFTLAGGDHYRPQPSLRRLRGHRRTGHRLSGLRLHHRRRQRHHRRNPERKRICHILVRQEPQHARVSVQRRRTL